MFEAAATEVERARASLDRLREAPDQREFLVLFNAFVAAAQAVLIAVLREGRGERPPGFDAWYAAKREEMDADDVMILVREARDFDFQDGPHRLRFVVAADQFTADDRGQQPKPGAWWSLPADPSIHVAVDAAPGMHRGRRLGNTDPVALCEAVRDYLEKLLAEACSAVGAA